MKRPDMVLALAACLGAAALPAAAEGPLDSLPALAEGARLFDGAAARRGIGFSSPNAVRGLGRTRDAGADLDGWISREEITARQRMFANISPAGAAPGSVAASPSTHDPDYDYDWVRDAALTMDSVVSLEAGASPSERQGYDKALLAYAQLSRRQQTEPSAGGDGEPKYDMDGAPYTGPWARPQNDGPALRALTLIHFARSLLSRGQTALVRSLLYDGKLPTNSVIKTDLEYVAHHWGDACYDLWEETYGRHFFTEMMQRRALVEGAKLARDLGDPGAADYYQSQVEPLSREIERHWDPGRNIIVETLDQQGMDYKKSGLDSAVVLAVLYGEGQDDFFPPTDDRVLATVLAQEKAFDSLYPLNRAADPGADSPVAIGRYPEDRYGGGNPWILSTEGFGEFYYRLAKELRGKGSIRVNDINGPFYRGLAGPSGAGLAAGTVLPSSDPRYAAILAALARKGDAQESLVRAHAGPGGELSEQMDRNSGAMSSAQDLSWNYAAFMAEDSARRELRGARH